VNGLPHGRTARPADRLTALLTALNRQLVAIETAAAGALIVVISLVVLLQVLLRYLFAYPSPWSEEVSRFSFIWVSLLGASLAVQHRSHFGFPLLVSRLGPRLRRAVSAVAAALTALTALLLVIAGLALVRLAAGQRSPALDLPMGWVYAAVPVSGALMLLHLLVGPVRAAPFGGRPEDADPGRDPAAGPTATDSA